MHQPRTDDFAGLGEREFVVLVALLQAMGALAIDAMLPALGVMAQELGATDPNQRQLVIGVFLIGMGLGALIPGALADRFGRRPVLLGCIAAYVVLTLACALVTDFTMMVAMRAAIGFSCAGLSVLPAAIVRDRFEGDKMARLQSMIMMVFMLVPMLAPMLGQAILLVAGWRWIFGFMALAGLIIGAWTWLRLGETLHPEYRQPIAIRTIGANMTSALTNRDASGYILGGALLLGSMWGYLNSSQQLIAEHFGAGTAFPIYFGAMAVAMSVANFTNARIVERFGARRVSHTALFVLIGCAALQWWLASSGSQTLWSFVPIQGAMFCLMGFIGANFSAIALQPFARIAGAAASAQAFIRVVGGSTLGYLVGQAYDGSARPLAMTQTAAALVVLGLILYSERGRLFRRVWPAGAPRPDYPVSS